MGGIFPKAGVVCINPASGKRPFEWGGWLGTSIVQDVGQRGSKGLYPRAGRIPAPMLGYRD